MVTKINFFQHPVVTGHEVAEGAKGGSDQPQEVVKIAEVLDSFNCIIIHILPDDVENGDDNADEKDDQIELSGVAWVFKNMNLY